MNKQEAAITTRINKWFPRMIGQSCPYEVKHTRGEVTFKLRELKQHQRDYLLAATTEHGMHWKIPDTGFGQCPFDSFVFKNSPAFVIIAYPTFVFALNIEEVDNMILNDQKTLSEDEANAYAVFGIEIKNLPR